MIDLKLYSVSDNYIEYLRSNVDGHVFANKDERYVHTRKYVGVVLTIDKYKYYIPMSSPKNSDYIFSGDGSKVIRKSIVPIIRMIDKSEDGTVELMGTLKISNMIPVPEGELALYELDKESDLKYKDLVEKEVRYINRHTREILRNAEVLYRQKTSDRKDIGYLKSTTDFKRFEKAHDDFEKNQRKGTGSLVWKPNLERR